MITPKSPPIVMRRHITNNHCERNDMPIYTKPEKDGEYGRDMVLYLFDAEINSLFIRLGEMGYTKEDIVARLRTLYDNPTVTPT